MPSTEWQEKNEKLCDDFLWMTAYHHWEDKDDKIIRTLVISRENQSDVKPDEN